MRLIITLLVSSMLAIFSRSVAQSNECMWSPVVEFGFINYPLGKTVEVTGSSPGEFSEQWRPTISISFGVERRYERWSLMSSLVFWRYSMDMYSKGSYLVSDGSQVSQEQEISFRHNYMGLQVTGGYYFGKFSASAGVGMSCFLVGAPAAYQSKQEIAVITNIDSYQMNRMWKYYDLENDRFRVYLPIALTYHVGSTWRFSLSTRITPSAWGAGIPWYRDNLTGNYLSGSEQGQIDSYRDVSVSEPIGQLTLSIGYAL